MSAQDRRLAMGDECQKQESVHLRLQFARAIAKPGSLALLIDPANRGSGRTSLEDTVRRLGARGESR